MSKRNLAWRRHQSNRIQTKRFKKWKEWGWLMDEKSKGKARKTNFCCGCSYCKHKSKDYKRKRINLDKLD